MKEHLNIQLSLKVIARLAILTTHKPTSLECFFGEDTTHVTLEIVAKYENADTQTILMGICPLQLVNDFNTYLLQLWLNHTTELWKTVLASEYALNQIMAEEIRQSDHWMMMHTIFNQKHKSIA